MESRNTNWDSNFTNNTITSRVNIRNHCHWPKFKNETSRNSNKPKLPASPLSLFRFGGTIKLKGFLFFTLALCLCILFHYLLFYIFNFAFFYLFVYSSLVSHTNNFHSIIISISIIRSLYITILLSSQVFSYLF
jgi:hypothetical protein